MYSFYLIYRTICIVNNKFYIGKHKTNNLNDNYLGSGKLLKTAIAKYGRNNFVREILHFCSSEEEMNELETKIVNAEMIMREDTYNIAIGGQGGLGVAQCISDEKRKEMTHRMAQTKSGRTKEDFEYLQRISNKLLGKNKFNTEHHRKNSERMSKENKENSERCRTHSEFMKIKMKGANNHNAKNWILENPIGEVIETGDIKLFCQEHDLAYSIFRYKAQVQNTLPVTRGKSKGWKVISSYSKT